MKITKEQLKNIVRETLTEESEYQTFFKKALEKAGKSIPQMSDDEKKSFFNKIEKAWKGRGEKKNEGNAFGAAVAKAKKDGDDSFKVGGKEYKVEESINENRFFDAFKKFFSKAIEKEVPTFGQVAKKYKKKDDFIKWFLKSQAKMGVVFKNDGYGAYMMNRMGRIWDRVHGQPEDKRYVGPSINEGASTEEKRIAMLAVRKQAKYRNVDLATAIRDQIRALEELERDVKKGKKIK